MTTHTDISVPPRPHSGAGQRSPNLIPQHDISVPPQPCSEVGQESPSLLPQHDIVPSVDRSNSPNNVKEDVSLIQTSHELKTQPNLVRTKSWRAPFIMLFSLLSATILAILHDRMNRSLNGNTVDSNGPWNQQWTSRYATALAFLIRMFFVTCVGTAFVQRQWLNLSTYQQAIRVQNLDVLSNALATPFSLFSHLAWLRNPLLLTIALISWTLPFAAVVTPGTLSVEPRPYTYSANRSALRLSGDDLFLVWVPGQLSEPEVAYLRPSPRLSSLAFTVATASQILSMKSNIANQTYFMNFTGPALKCADANATMIAKLGHLRFDDGAALEYLAWIGDTAPWLQIENSTLQQSILQDYIFYDSAPDVFDPTMENPIESADNTLWIINGDYMNTTSANGPLNVKECQLWNASYETEFTYRNFEPTTVIHGFTYHNPILSISTSNSTIYRTIAQSNYFHKAILAGFGSLIIGADVGNSSKSYQPSILERFGILSARNSTQFGKTLEDNFQNLTMSLFSVPEFLESTADTMSTSITTWSNTYVYQQQDLLLAYSISFLVSLICCILGLHSFYRNGSSFQNNFSTYIRAAESSNFDIRATVSPGDTGADPLPKKIGETMITMVSKQTR